MLFGEEGLGQHPPKMVHVFFLRYQQRISPPICTYDYQASKSYTLQLHTKKTLCNCTQLFNKHNVLPDVSNPKMWVFHLERCACRPTTLYLPAMATDCRAWYAFGALINRSIINSNMAAIAVKYLTINGRDGLARLTVIDEIGFCSEGDWKLCNRTSGVHSTTSTASSHKDYTIPRPRRTGLFRLRPRPIYGVLPYTMRMEWRCCIGGPTCPDLVMSSSTTVGPWGTSPDILQSKCCDRRGALW